MAVRRKIRSVVLVLLGGALGLAALTIELSYPRLHLFLLAPLLALALVPPRPLESAEREVRRGAYVITVVLTAIAFAFSCLWDNLPAWRGVWTVEAHMTIGTAGFMPFEEYFWFIDHTLLASFWVLRLWSSRRTRSESFATSRRETRTIGAGLCLLAALCGLWLLQFERTFYLGVLLSFMSPVAAFQWWFCGHLLVQQPREWIMGIAVPSIYLLLLDTWAIHRGLWRISQTYTTGLHLFGVQLEQILVYTTTTALVVQPLVSTLRATEIGLQKEG
jgi:putative membrane protein